MKFRVERDALADAVAWTAKSLPSRPSVPVLAGVLLRVADQRLQVSGFDYEVSSQVSVEVQADADGAALVSGRLLAEITKALPNKPADIAAVGHAQHDTGQHGYGGAAGQALRRPGHGVGECVSLHPELHAVLRVACMSGAWDPHELYCAGQACACPGLSVRGGGSRGRLNPHHPQRR